MPHFIIDCSENILNIKSPQDIIQLVYDSAESTDLFQKGDIKVRINPYKYYNVGNSQDDFIHVFANILEGRTDAQKMNLSRRITADLKAVFQNVPIISINVRDFEKASYCNKSMVWTIPIHLQWIAFN